MLLLLVWVSRKLLLMCRLVIVVRRRRVLLLLLLVRLSLRLVWAWRDAGRWDSRSGRERSRSRVLRLGSRLSSQVLLVLLLLLLLLLLEDGVVSQAVPLGLFAVVARGMGFVTLERNGS